ncbi:GlmU family protein [Thermostilla marina]
MKLVLFEDAKVQQLYPMTLARPAFAVSCGSYRLVELVGRLGLDAYAIVREYLRAIVEAEFGLAEPEDDGRTNHLLFVNARAVPSIGTLRVLTQLKENRLPKAVRGDGEIAAALVDIRQTPLPDSLTPDSVAGWLESLELESCVEQIEMSAYPHEVLKHHLRITAANLQDRLAQGDYREVRDGVFVGENVSLGEYLVADTSEGPIVIDRDASIGPFCFLQGPVYVGPGSKIIEHAALKEAVALGHTTKVGGEVEGSTIEPYTNKQHHGFLGHSYLGSWVNLGAGTCNSDLKNTYGTVSVEYRGKRVATGMQFVGCVIGDYSKTAINTSIFTGKIIGVCSMVYGFVTTNVPSFTNYARTFGQMSEIPVEVVLAGQQRMFKRRKVEQRPCDIALIQAMHALTASERQLSDEPLSF